MKTLYKQSVLSIKKLKLRAVIGPFQRFAQLEASSGLVLILFALLAMLWANCKLTIEYHHFWNLPLSLGLGPWVLSESLHFWINDGLMVLFFLVVGLEIKREILDGELQSAQKAALPIVAALGGMLCPALIYVFFNAAGSPSFKGWAIPTATDIAFALGVLALLGRAVPLGLKVFLTALAIIDDLGAIVVIALFYSEQISWPHLAAGLGLMVVLFALNRIGIQRLWPYLLVGFFLWLAVLGSGVHATLAGVLLATTIPLRHPKAQPGAAMSSPSPLVKLEHAMHPWVSFLILPLFALANAGLSLQGNTLAQSLTSPVSLGVISGLMLGKQTGITLFSWLVVKSGLARLPDGIRWAHIYGAGWLGGIGFTMSLFIAGLSFDGTGYFEQAKIGIVLASLGSGIVGWLVLFQVFKRDRQNA